MKLMIIESPGKMTLLSSILGSDWTIAPCYGHVRDLPKSRMGVEAPNFLPEYELTDKGANVVSKLKKIAKQADTIYLATDPDREGESISWHLQECLGLINPLRVTFNEITESTVKAALASPRRIDIKRVHAQDARRSLDRLVGYTVSPELSNRTGAKLSAGRVQSPAVRLVVERERAISAFESITHYGASLFLKNTELNNEWSAEWLIKPNFVTDDNPYFMDKSVALSVSEVKSVIVRSCEESEESRSPPPPFTTSTLQQAASVTLNLNPTATMDAAQKLYEQGHITYHRTDNPNVSLDSLDDIRAIANNLDLAMADKFRKYKVSENAQESHPAITPTHWDVEVAGESDDQRALYKLIRLRAIACQLADARYAVRSVKLDSLQPVTINGKSLEFEGRGRTLIYNGWLKLIQSDQTDESDSDSSPTNPVPVCLVGNTLDVERGQLLEKKTKAPSRYTQASLVKQLEAEGIGRPSTYASIMDNIVSRAYVSFLGKFLIPTKTGELVVDSLVGKFDFIEYEFTRNVEQELDAIADGKADYKTVVSNVYETLKKEITGIPLSAAAESHLCTKCNKPLIHRIKPGKGGYDFWGCSGFKDGCKSSYKDKNGKPDFGKVD